MKLKTIDSCGYCEYIPWGSNKRCQHPDVDNDEEIFEAEPIPSWCPLPDAEVKDEE